jgi:hypothetical protein
MAKWLADQVPEWVVATMLIVLLPLLILFVETRLHRRLPHWRTGKHNDATAIMVSVAAVVYSVAIGLCVITLWDRWEAAHAATEGEATNLAALAESSSICGPEVSSRIRDQVVAYNQDVVDGWALRIHGEQVPRVSVDMNAIEQSIVAIQPANEAERAYVKDAVIRLGTAIELRHTAIRLARDQQLPNVLWISVLAGSAVVLSLCLTCGVADSTIRRILIVGVTVTVAVNLFLVVELNYPFYGDISVGPEAYLRVIDQLRGAN